MKRLFLLRHAKSDWDDPTLADFDRPLNKRGKKAAPRMGEWMRERGLKPALIISSPARRARDTLSLVLESSGIKSKVRYDQRIYEATAGQLLEVLSEIADSTVEVMLVGHNPGLENLLESLTGEAQRMPTGGLARIQLTGTKWRDAIQNGGRLDWFVKPKDLPEE